MIIINILKMVIVMCVMSQMVFMELNVDIKHGNIATLGIRNQVLVVLPVHHISEVRIDWDARDCGPFTPCSQRLVRG